MKRISIAICLLCLLCLNASAGDFFSQLQRLTVKPAAGGGWLGPAGCIGAWNTASGNLMLDSINGATLTNLNGAVVSGDQFAFAGDDDYWLGSAPNTKNLGDNWTVLLWTKITEDVAGSYVLANYRDDLPTGGWQIESRGTELLGIHDDSLTLRLIGFVNQVARNIFYSSQVDTLPHNNAWHSCAVTVANATNIARVVTMYIDHAASTADLWTGDGNTTSVYGVETNGLRIGKGWPSETYYMKGRIYALSIYTNVLTAAQCSNELVRLSPL